MTDDRVFARYVRGEADDEAFDDAISEWHAGDSVCSLPIFLGMSEKEYGQFLGPNGSLEELAESRRKRGITSLGDQKLSEFAEEVRDVVEVVYEQFTGLPNNTVTQLELRTSIESALWKYRLKHRFQVICDLSINPPSAVHINVEVSFKADKSESVLLIRMGNPEFVGSL